jgi:hypothetical protein
MQKTHNFGLSNKGNSRVGLYYSLLGSELVKNMIEHLCPVGQFIK